MENLSWGSYKKLTAVASIMHQTSLEIFESGKRSLESENNRKDVLTTLSELTLTGATSESLLTFGIIVRANMVSDAQSKMSDDEVIAQIR